MAAVPIRGQPSTPSRASQAMASWPARQPRAKQEAADSGGVAMKSRCQCPRLAGARRGAGVPIARRPSSATATRPATKVFTRLVGGVVAGAPSGREGSQRIAADKCSAVEHFACAAYAKRWRSCAVHVPGARPLRNPVRLPSGSGVPNSHACNRTQVGTATPELAESQRAERVIGSGVVRIPFPPLSRYARLGWSWAGAES